MMLEELEREALALSASLGSHMRQIIAAGGNSTQVDYDTAEMVGHLHNIQRMIFQNIAARWHDDVRPLGGSLQEHGLRPE